MNILSVCFDADADADAGGGPFVGTFTFMNRKDNSIVLHPFLLWSIMKSWYHIMHFRLEKKKWQKLSKILVECIMANNLMPLDSVTRYASPLMNITMGETNNVLMELKETTMKLEDERNVGSNV
jgi:hypothetical protein